MGRSSGAHPEDVVHTQYRTDSNLGKRLDLHRRFSVNPYGWHRWVFDHIALPDDARILELGGGPGTLWLENRDRIAPGWRITLSDSSPGMIASAREHLADVASSMSFEVIDAESIPYGDDAFDGVIANHMLYHVRDRAAALSEIRRVLRPGGRLYASTNGRRHMEELDALIHRYAPDMAHDNVAERFGLENGQDQLAPWFGAVERHDYPDRLEITEAEPSIQYVASMSDMDCLTEAHLEQMRRTVTDTIARTGAFRVTKAAGLFTCRVEE